MKVIKANILAPDANVAIIIARFNHFINNSLLDGALDVLQRVGQVRDSNITVIWVPGAYELPLIANVLSKSNKYDGIIALGTIMRGSTAHFEHLASEVSKGISDVTINSYMPIAFGILTTDNIEQAIERAGSKAGNKGAEAALTILEMINILKAL
ncbi:6,7-dimethyl-8-ribityllumazine synthase [Candidatus Ishikawella capsulata]|uniref:6,7-dimethyl-8-ribityllumazine synthase n=1 Tax=Candidatus Ishikawaella capsulata Mpkobe TaxID=476281 RepID=C5WCP2_9ENTR|nr:6,7-dimethyl-8-ribityllumazine synthase [Candidatus Ishikawaella capsulata]BAH83098.1 riboflavin synthase subunit beta [Candidatus Ishikawaella capsulata Mpkobe]